MVEDVNDVLGISNADNSVCLGKLLRSLLLIPLNEAACNDYLFEGTLLLELAQLKNGVDSLLLCGLYKAAGIYAATSASPGSVTS